MTRICSIIVYFVLLYLNKYANSEEFNLFGNSGQAYGIEVNLGHPHQRLKVLVDTGSTTLAIASYAQENSKYFHTENSTSIFKSGKQVQAKYSQGRWLGQLVSDLVQFPSLNIPEVRSEVALITESQNFFVNGSDWQGLLGLAYLPVGAWGENVVVESWLDSVDRALNKPMSFELKLCGVQSATNATHYGNFLVLDDVNTYQMFQTPILRKRWYEIGVVSIHVMTSQSRNSTLIPVNVTDGFIISDMSTQDPDEEICTKLNEEKSILDSGTTNIKLPDVLFREIVDEIRNAAQASNVIILDGFWYHGEAACWPDPQNWSLPWIAVDLLSAEIDNQYFRLEIPPQNYMRVMSAHNGSNDNEFPEFCYKLGLEAGGKETVLGYTAMEGFQVLFNRSSGWIGFRTSNCGPKARISGPYNASTSLISLCKLSTPEIHAIVSTKYAIWILCALSVVVSVVLIYLFASPCRKMFRRLPRSQQISLSQAALVEQESA